MRNAEPRQPSDSQVLTEGAAQPRAPQHGSRPVAIARAPDPGSLLDALRAKEQRRAAIQAELAALDGLGRVRSFDAATLTPPILAKLGDWAGLMGLRVGQARQILRHLLVGRIRFTPQADGWVEFVGYASIGPLVAGTVLAELSKAVVSPRGYGVLGVSRWRSPATWPRSVDSPSRPRRARTRSRRQGGTSPPLPAILPP